MRFHIGPIIAAILLLGTASIADAQSPIDADALARIERAVPSQPFYPPGYYDVRIAAESEVSDMRGELVGYVNLSDDGEGRVYDLIGCGHMAIEPDYADAETLRFGNLALEVSLIRNVMERLGYPEGVYVEPLLAYEQRMIALAAARSEIEVRADLGIATDAEYELLYELEQARPQTQSGTGTAPAFDLAAAIEVNRIRLSPELPAVVAQGGCGDAPPAPVVIRAEPVGARLLLIGAFAFKVCTRRLPDPWDPIACRWREVELGAPTKVRGRAVYQIRWPDGSEQRGAREFDLNYDSAAPTYATFRKSGG